MKKYKKSTAKADLIDICEILKLKEELGQLGEKYAKAMNCGVLTESGKNQTLNINVGPIPDDPENESHVSINSQGHIKINGNIDKSSSDILLNVEGGLKCDGMRP